MRRKLVKNSKPHVIVIGPYPPPHNGAAKNTLIWSDKLTGCGYEVVRIVTSVKSGSAHTRSKLYHVQRITRSLINVFFLCRTMRKESTVYMVPDGGWGLVYCILYAATIRLKTPARILVHHRNFDKIATGNWLLRLFCSIIGSNGQHIFLTESMRTTFEGKFYPTRSSQIISNAATCDVGVFQEKKLSGSLTIGFLSNLNNDKGFNIVAASFLQLACENTELRFAIAGSSSDTEAEELLKTLKNHLGDKLEIFGHVIGEKKRLFFEGIDVFVFPTVYKLEAQPNVLIEALASGTSIVATDYVCIPETLYGSHHQLIAKGKQDEMALNLVAKVKMLIADLEKIENRSKIFYQNITAFKKMHCESSRIFNNLLETICHR